MWEVKSLTELEEVGLVKLGRGKIISKKDLAASPGDFPVYSSSKVGDGKFGEYGLHMFEEELITWSVDGGGRLFHRKKHKFSITNVTGFLRILDASVLSYKYLYYALSLLHSKINFDWVKKAHPSVLRKEYKHIPVPPLAEQQRIVAKLDAAFAEIDGAIEVAESNLANTKALLPSTIDRLISDTNKNKETTIADETSMLSGFAFKSNEFTEAEGDIALLRGDNIAPGSLNFLEAKRFPISEFSSYEKFSLSENDIVLGMDRPWISSGLRVAMLKKQHLPCLLVQRVMRLRTTKELCAEYLYILMQSDSFLKHILGNQTGLGVPHISGKTIGSYNFYLPTIDTQTSLVEKFSETEKDISQLKNIFNSKLKNLAFLKSSILAQELQSEAA